MKQRNEYFWSTLGLLMTWCRKTKSSVAEVLRYTFQFRSIIFPRNYVVFMTLRKLWRHQMETFAALLVLCTGNSPVTGEFPAQRPVTRSFDTSMWYINILYKSMAWHKTAVIPLQTHWSYCSLVLNHKNDGTIHKIWRPLSRPKSLTWTTSLVSKDHGGNHLNSMMTSSNGNIFRVTGHLWGEFTGPRWIPHTKASDAGLWCFFDLRLNKPLSKLSWGWWFETLSRPLWRHCNEGNVKK